MGRAAEVARQIGWYWGTLMGDNHYRRYVEHRGRPHPESLCCPNVSTGECATTPSSPIPIRAAVSSVPRDFCTRAVAAAKSTTPMQKSAQSRAEQLLDVLTADHFVKPV